MLDELADNFADRGINFGMKITGFAVDRDERRAQIERIRATFDPANLGGKLEEPVKQDAVSPAIVLDI